MRRHAVLVDSTDLLPVHDELVRAQRILGSGFEKATAGLGLQLQIVDDVLDLVIQRTAIRSPLKQDDKDLPQSTPTNQELGRHGLSFP